MEPKVDERILGAVYTELWDRAQLDFLRHAKQLDFKQKFRASTNRKFYLNNSRRWGKSHELVLTALETCLSIKGARVLYLCEQGTDAELIAGDLVQRLLSGVDDKGIQRDYMSCPKHLIPHYSGQKKEFTFNNGSVWRLKGTNGDDAKHLRGMTPDLIILDEAANMQDLEFIVKSILMPMFMTKPKGKMLIATTPARTPSHYTTQLHEECARVGAAITYTIQDIPHVSDADKIEFLIQAGEDPDEAWDVLRGTKPPRSTTTRREYFCEFVTDDSLAIFPEFDAKARAEIVKDWKRPDYADCYVAMDPGSRDNSGVIFFFYDFLAGKIVVEDEVLLNNASTVQIAEAISKKELELWGIRAEPKRVSDVDLRLIQDLNQMYGLQFQSVRGKNVLADINLIRHLISQRMLVISPKCTGFIRQLTNVIWNSTGKDFYRDKEGIDKHFDLVAAAKYGFRFVNYRKNPYPGDYWGKGSPLRQARGTKPKVDIRGDTPIARKLKKK